MDRKKLKDIEVDVSRCNETLAKAGLSIIKKSESKLYAVEITRLGCKRETISSDSESDSESKSGSEYGDH